MRSTYFPSPILLRGGWLGSLKDGGTGCVSEWIDRGANVFFVVGSTADCHQYDYYTLSVDLGLNRGGDGGGDEGREGHYYFA